MSKKHFSNTYIFFFALIMVTFVAILLSFVSMQLKPLQMLNMETEKREDILKSVGKAEKADEVSDKNSYITEQFGEFITESYVVDYQGDTVNADAFEVTLHIAEEVAKDPKDRDYPVFVYTGPDGAKKYIVPVRGKGLWGPIWGYISFDADMNTINGAVFDHQGETPGLGAQIATEGFQVQFKGKTIFDDSGKFVSIDVVKGGAPPDAPHKVDAISGGTLTSKGLQAMLSDCLQGYVNHFRQVRNES
jgi:Na+-transporting NADH:ubiquinone oxidoreductase subunit C